MTVRHAVVLAAGLGTRLLPATKAVPKEMVPIVDRPLIQYAVEEITQAGIEEIVIVVADGKGAIAEHFARDGRIAEAAKAKGDRTLLETVEAPAALANFHYAHQHQALGIAHAVACAREYVEGVPFALLFPDDLILAKKSVVAQLVEAYGESTGSLIAVQEVQRNEIQQYGIIDPAAGGNPMPLRGMVEKPSPEVAPSSFGIVGRYILGPTIFEHIDRIVPGANGELQLTDALAHQLAAGEEVRAFLYEGDRYDTGRPAGLLIAGLAAGLRRPDIGPALRERLAPLLDPENI